MYSKRRVYYKTIQDKTSASRSMENGTYRTIKTERMRYNLQKTMRILVTGHDKNRRVITTSDVDYENDDYQRNEKSSAKYLQR